MMKKMGYLFLVIGFIAMVFMCVNVSAKTYASYIWQRNNLADKQVSLEDASTAIRNVTLESNKLVRQTIWPAIGMLIGGLLIGIQNQKKESQQSTAP